MRRQQLSLFGVATPKRDPVWDAIRYLRGQGVRVRRGPAPACSTLESIEMQCRGGFRPTTESILVKRAGQIRMGADPWWPGRKRLRH